jgi:hypothetical protein
MAFCSADRNFTGSALRSVPPAHNTGQWQFNSVTCSFLSFLLGSPASIIFISCLAYMLQTVISLPRIPDYLDNLTTPRYPPHFKTATLWSCTAIPAVRSSPERYSSDALPRAASTLRPYDNSPDVRELLFVSNGRSSQASLV